MQRVSLEGTPNMAFVSYPRKNLVTHAVFKGDAPNEYYKANLRKKRSQLLFLPTMLSKYERRKINKTS
jgi:hypothetical protein